MRRSRQHCCACQIAMPRLDAHPLGGVAGGQHDAVAVLLAAADGDAFAAQGGVFLHFDAGVVGVAIYMKNVSARHTQHPFGLIIIALFGNFKSLFLRIM